MRLSMLLNPKRSELLNRMVTLLPGEQGRSRRNPVGQPLDQRWAHGFYVTMTVSSGGSFVLLYAGCHYPRQPTQNSRPKFQFPLNQHNQFAPRLRDLGDQQLYRLAMESDFGAVNQLLTGRLHLEWFLNQWDDLLRVAGSLKLGWVTASLLISKLNAMPKHNTLVRAMQEYGRLIKTIFILRYLSSPEFRRQINRQLNKGEQLHSLRRYLMVAQEAQIRKRYPDDQLNQAHCLNLVTNAVVVWNTVYMWEALKQLKREGYQIDEEEVKHLSPARYEHLNVYGKYSFPVQEELGRKCLRPLRQSGEDE